MFVAFSLLHGSLGENQSAHMLYTQEKQKKKENQEVIQCEDQNL